MFKVGDLVKGNYKAASGRPVVGILVGHIGESSWAVLCEDGLLVAESENRMLLVSSSQLYDPKIKICCLI